MVVKKILIDLSGTIHIGNDVIPGAVDALKRLRKEQVSIKFVTNTTKECRRILHERLLKLGFDIDINEIWSSLWATRQVVLNNHLNPMLLIDNDALEDFSDIKITKNETKDSVVIGLAPDHFNYPKLNEAFRVLLDGGRLIGIHQAKYFKDKNGLSLGPGLFVKGLEYAANCKAEIVGKPCAEFFQTALEGVEACETIMIGDDVTDDIDGAQKIGIFGILVKTGKYRNGDENLISPPPKATVNDFSQAVDLIVNMIRN